MTDYIAPNTNKIITKFKNTFKFYKKKEFHENCILSLLNELNNDKNTSIAPNDNLNILNNLSEKVPALIKEKLNNYNTFEILKDVLIWDELIKFEKVIPDDIQNTIYYLKSILAETLPARKTRNIDLVNLQKIIQYVLIFSILERNIKIYKYIDETYSLFDYCNEPIKQDEFDRYFEEYQKMSKFDKPEDSNELTQNTIEQLKNQSLLPEQINSSTLLQAELGFSYQDFLNFMNAISNLKALTIYSGKTSYYSNLLKMDKQILENLLDFFSFQNDSKYNYLLIELHPIYKHKDIFYFTSMVVQQATTIFMHLISSEHFIEYYGIKNKYIFKKAQGLFTKFLSYKIADILKRNSYVIPCDEKGNLMVDLIIREESLPNEINDVDVLALDPNKKVIYNIELKYYKPALFIEDIFKDSFPETHVKKILERRTQLCLIKPYLLREYFNINSDGCEYEIKNFLITARPKYKSVYNNNSEVDMMSYFSFIEKINNGKNLTE